MFPMLYKIIKNFNRTAVISDITDKKTNQEK
jgi:hypothetical protein